MINEAFQSTLHCFDEKRSSTAPAGVASLSGQLLIRCPENSTYFFFTGGKANYGFSREGHKKIGQTLLEYQLKNDGSRDAGCNRPGAMRKKRELLIDVILPMSKNEPILPVILKK